MSAKRRATWAVMAPAASRPQDLAEVIAQLRAVSARAQPPSRPQVEEARPAAVGQRVPGGEPGEQLEHRQPRVAGDVARRGGAVGDERAAAARASATSRRFRVRRRGRRRRPRRPGRARARARGRPRCGSRPGARRAAQRARCWAGPAVPITRMPRVARELDERRADAAGRTEHDDRLPGGDPRAAVQHPPRGHAVDDDGLGRLADRRPSGTGTRSAASSSDAVGPAADLGQRRDALPDAGVVAAAGRALDDADEVVAGDERERRAGRSTCRGASAARRTTRRWPGRARAPGPGPAPASSRRRTCSDSGSPIPGSTISVVCISRFLDLSR